MKYYIHLRDHSIPKNGLHKAIVKYLESIRQTVTDDVDATIRQVKDKVDELNKANSRCRPVMVGHRNAENDSIGINFGYYWTCNLMFYPIKSKETVICPECMKETLQEELDMFGGLCEDCMTED